MALEFPLASIPLCFKAITYNDNLYIDGAFSDNFPTTDYFKDDIENTLGVTISIIVVIKVI